MKKTALAILVMLVISAAPSLATLDCIVENPSCTSPRIKVLGMGNAENTHAELPAYSDYSYHICCKDTGGINVGTDPSGVTFLLLSNYTNAHVENTTGINGYEYSANISTNNPYYIMGCGYKENDCSGWDTCLASISDSTNAHIGNCSSYTTKVCCSLTYIDGEPPVIPEFSTIGAILAMVIAVIGMMLIVKRR